MRVVIDGVSYVGEVVTVWLDEYWVIRDLECHNFYSMSYDEDEGDQYLEYIQDDLILWWNSKESAEQYIVDFDMDASQIYVEHVTGRPIKLC